jgi:hypothetical protein
MQTKTSSERIRRGIAPLSGRGTAPAQALPGSSSQPAKTYIPRRMRSKLLADAALARGKRLGVPILENIEAMIAATGGEFFRINQIKIGVENLLLGREDRARMCYGEIARSLPSSLDDALVEVTLAYRSELAHLATLQAVTHGSRHHGMVLNRIDKLHNVRLILRLIRFTGHADAYPEIREAVAAEIPLVEAMRGFHRSVNPAGYRR